MKTLVKCVQCTNCGDLIYSRARHDFHGCSCCELNVDGGFDYLRVLGNWNQKVIKKFINASKKELYFDWSKGINKYGTIKPKTYFI